MMARLAKAVLLVCVLSAACLLASAQQQKPTSKYQHLSLEQKQGQAGTMMRRTNALGRQSGPKAATAEVEYPGNPEYVSRYEYQSRYPETAYRDPPSYPAHPGGPDEYPDDYPEHDGEPYNRAYRGGPRDYEKDYYEKYSGGKHYEYDEGPYPHHDGRPRYGYKPRASTYGHREHKKGKAPEEVWQVQKVIVKGMPAHSGNDGYNGQDGHNGRDGLGFCDIVTPRSKYNDTLGDTVGDTATATAVCQAGEYQIGGSCHYVCTDTSKLQNVALTEVAIDNGAVTNDARVLCTLTTTKSGAPRAPRLGAAGCIVFAKARCCKK